MGFFQLIFFVCLFLFFNGISLSFDSFYFKAVCSLHMDPYFGVTSFAEGLNV